MGTSKSSAGPGKGVGLVPQWLDVPGAPPPQPAQPPPQPPAGGNNPGPPPGAPVQPPPLVPPPPPQVPPVGQALPRRFADARRALRDYVKDGRPGRLRAGLGSYVSKGYRGSSNASARMGQAATSAGRAYNVLSGIADGSLTPEQLGFDPATMAGAPVEDIIDALVDAICANDTTLDDGAGRLAVNDALSQVLAEHPDIDAFDMPVEHTREVWLRTLAYHVYDDIMLDLGPSLERGAEGNAPLLNERRFEIRGFVLENYREQFELVEAAGRTVDKTTADAIAREVSAAVLDVYEGWAE